MVLLTSSDNEEFCTEKDIIIRSVLVKNMLEDVGEDEDTPIPLPNVTASILKKILELCEHHRKDPPPDQSQDADETRRHTSEISEWDKKFCDVDQETLVELILAANYLDVKDLLDAGCKTVANMVKGKTAEEIRKLFNIVNGFTPDEQEEIRKENEWAEGR